MKISRAGSSRLRSSCGRCLMVFAGVALSNGASAQVVEGFSAILSDIQGSDYCAQSSSEICEAYDITPRTDLEMRFAAPEELASLKVSVKEFSAQQMGAIANRMQALRSGAAGGGASSDDTLGRSHKFSGFVTYSRGTGKRDQTGYEDASDFTGNDVLMGLDYRVNANFVGGLAVGYSSKDMKLSSLYVGEDDTIANARAKTETSGFGITAYGQYETGGFHASSSIGNQWLANDLQRRADYYTASESVPVTAQASPDSANLQASVGSGYTWSLGANSIGLAVNGVFQRLRTEGFRETGALCPAGTICEGVDLNMQFESQIVKSMEASTSLHLQRAMTLGAGVAVPFVDADFIWQLERQRSLIKGMYAPLYGLVDNFSLATDKPDSQHMAVSAGFVFVGQNGWQGFMRFRHTVGLTYVSANLLAAGLRYEFP